MMIGLKCIRRDVPVIIPSRIDALLHRMFALFAGPTQREPQDAAHEQSAKYNRSEGHQSVVAHIQSSVIQTLTPERARHV